jgi:DNA polymerase-3 subunit epsilon
LHDPADLESLAATLEASGRYRVLRRLERRPSRAPPPGVELHMCLYLDIETTGLDPKADEIIELAMLPFWFSRAGEVFRIGEAFQAFRQPSRPIGPDITAITGITDAMVEGCVIDPAMVSAFAAPAVLIVAHNAAFDRRFMERFCDTFSTKAWGCSMAEVDWKGEGHAAAGLQVLASGCGFFYEAHRAAHDCEAGLEILARPLPRSGLTALSRLLESVRKPVHRIWAEYAPFELKDVLRQRGYRWNPEGNPAPKAWYIDVAPDAVDAELTFLKREIYQREVQLLTRVITAYDRYSERC